MPWQITRQTHRLVRQASAVILYTWFIICFFISIGHRPVFSEGKAPTETFNKLSGFDHNPDIAEHPWIERALALGFSEQFGFSSLPLRALAREATHSGPKRLIVLIESDGAPWQAAGYRPPSNPTPKAPISLQMALHTPTGDQLLYLGRPCQFIGSAHELSKTCEDANTRCMVSREPYSHLVLSFSLSSLSSLSSSPLSLTRLVRQQIHFCEFVPIHVHFFRRNCIGSTNRSYWSILLGVHYKIQFRTRPCMQTFMH